MTHCLSYQYRISTCGTAVNIQSNVPKLKTFAGPQSKLADKVFNKLTLGKHYLVGSFNKCLNKIEHGQNPRCDDTVQSHMTTSNHYKSTESLVGSMRNRW